MGYKKQKGRSEGRILRQMKVSCHCRRGNERRSCLGVVAAEIVCQDDAHDVPLLGKTESDAKSAPSVAHITPRCHPRRYGAHGSGRRRGGHRIAGGSAGKSCNGQTTKNRRAAAAASTTTTAGRRRRRRGRDQITDGRPDNLSQLLCSSAKRMTSRFSQVHG